MRRDRTGEVLDDQAAELDHWRTCDGGWLDREADHPRPCPRCRPWLIERRPPTRAELADARSGVLTHR